jgi:cytochrome b involved in lipid metabolism
MSSEKIYTWEDVAKHASENWIVINNVVYNPTDYLDEHPGGN